MDTIAKALTMYPKMGSGTSDVLADNTEMKYIEYQREDVVDSVELQQVNYIV